MDRLPRLPEWQDQAWLARQGWPAFEAALKTLHHPEKPGDLLPATPARTRLAEQLGLQLREMAEKQKYPVVLRTEIDYRRAARLGDLLIVDGWLDRIERVRFRCAFKVSRPSDDMLIAECQQTLALIELPAAKLLRLPQSWDQYRAAVTASD